MGKPRMKGFCLTFATRLDNEEVDASISDFLKIVDEDNITGITTTRELTPKEVNDERNILFKKCS